MAQGYPTVNHPSPTRPYVLTKSSGTTSLVSAQSYQALRVLFAYSHKEPALWHPTHTHSTSHEYEPGFKIAPSPRPAAAWPKQPNKQRGVLRRLSAPCTPPYHRVSGLCCGRCGGASELDWTSSLSRPKINLPVNQKGYDSFMTPVGKLSARRIQICLVQFYKTA